MATKTMCEVDRYEDNGDRSDDKAKVVVKSHSLHGDRVVIEIDGKKATVLARDIRNAVNRCSD